MSDESSRTQAESLPKRRPPTVSLLAAAVVALCLSLAGAGWLTGKWRAESAPGRSGPVPTQEACQALLGAVAQRLAGQLAGAASGGPGREAAGLAPLPGLPPGAARVWLDASDGERPWTAADARGASLEQALDAASRELVGKTRAGSLRWVTVHAAPDDGAAPSARRHGARPLGGCAWIAGAGTPAEVHVTFRDHRLYGPTPAEADAALTLAEGYLLRMLRPDGSFVYSYRADTGRSADDYNLLRHAGTVLTLLELHQRRPRPELLAAAKLALDYLKARVLPCPAPDPGDLCLVEGDEIKLGGNALAIVAFARYASLTGDRADLPLMQGLARRLLALQAPSGELTRHKQRRSTGAFAAFSSSYYPGESLLALLRLHQLDPDPRWLEGARLGAHYLIQGRDQRVKDAQLEHDHWLLYALDELHALAPDRLLEDYAERLAGAIEAAQNVGERWPLDWRGSWYDQPRTTPAATRSEGLLAAARLLLRAGRNDAAERALDTVHRALQFEMGTQIREESALYLAEPQRALGGFRASFDEAEIRIDYVQHNVAALLGYLKLAAVP